MKILLDINVILDIFLDRAPHAAASSAVWAAIEKGHVAGVLAAHAVTTIHYILKGQVGGAVARNTVESILRVLDVAAVDTQVICRALQFGWVDFEDAVTAAAAESADCEAIVSRDPKGFPRSPIRVLSPEAAAPLYGTA
jgi:predicted nucleic acid-binding protein